SSSSSRFSSVPAWFSQLDLPTPTPAPRVEPKGQPPAEREVRLAVLVPPPPAAPAPVAASIQGEGIRGLIDFVSSIGKQGLQLNSLCLSENAVKAFTRVGLGDGATLCTFILNMLNQETGGGKKAASDILSAILKMNAILEDNPESDLLTPQLQ